MTKYRTLLHLNALPTQISGKYVDEAHVRLYNSYSASCDTANTPIHLWRAYAWSTGATWNTQPASPDGSPQSSSYWAHGRNDGSACDADGYDNLDVTALARNWASGASSTKDFKLTSLENTVPTSAATKGYKEFNSTENASGDPLLVFTYRDYPTVTATPTIAPVIGTGPSGYWLPNSTATFAERVDSTSGSGVQGRFEVYQGGTLVWNGLGGSVAAGGTSQVTMPTSSGLADNTLYTLRVWGVSGGAVSAAWSPYLQFKIDSAAPSPTTVTSGHFPASTWTDGRSSGTFTFAATDTNFDHYLYGLDTPTPTTALDAGTTSVTVNGIGDGWHHLYARGVDKAGNLGPVADYVFGAGGVPLAPPSVTAEAGDEEATVSWSAADDNGAAVTGYRITTFTGSTQVATQVVGDDTSTTVTGLSNATAYHFTVAGINGIGEGASATSNTVTPAAAPFAPATVSGTRGDQQVSLVWSAADPNGSPVTGHVITTYQGDTVVDTLTVGSATSAVVPDLSNGTAYTFRVAASNAHGTGTQSPPSEPVTPAGAPAAPTGVRAAPRDGQAFVRWTAADPQGEAVTGYTVTALQGGTVIGTATVGAVSTATVTGLPNGYPYTFTVTATNALGTGAPSSTSGAVTPGPGSFSLNGGQAVGADPNAGFIEDVNPGLGSFVTTATDASVSTQGPALELSRTYNSVDLSDTGLGVGWTTNTSMSWQQDASSRVVVLYPDGRREAHTPDGTGGYTSPLGYASKLVASGSGFTLTQTDGTKYGLGSNHRLASITDAAGHQATLSYDTSGQLSTITAFSGRHLTLTWSNGHVSTVSTDPVVTNQPPLTWTYTYDTVDGATQLISVCDPRGTGTDHCTSYTYTAGLLSKITRPAGTTEAQIAYNPDGTVRQHDDGRGHVTTYDLNDPQKPVITEPGPASTTTTTEQTLDVNNRLTGELGPDGTRSFDYDANGFRDTATDENQNTTSIEYDANGNVLTSTDASNKTAHGTYDSDNNMLSWCDERSASLTDTTYCTTYAYDTNRHKLSETTADGRTRRWTYSTGSEPAIGGGTVPPGLLLTQSNFRAQITRFNYTQVGDLAESITPLGLRTALSYDALGRRVAETVYSDTFPSGVTTTWTYDGLGSVRTKTDPAVTNAITGVTHQLRVTNTYDKNENLITVEQSDVLGGDVARTTTYTYDALGRQVTSTDSQTGAVTTTEYDERGNAVRTTDQLGHVFATEYDAKDRPIKVTQLDVVDDPIGNSTPHDVVLKQTTYNPGGQVATDTDAAGNVTAYAYDPVGRILTITLMNFVESDGSSRSIVLERHAYDASGLVTDEYTGGDLRHVSNTYNLAGRLLSSALDPGGLNRTTTRSYDQDGNALTSTLSDGQYSETITFAYDAAGNITRTSVDNGSTTLVTTTAFDFRGVATQITDPRGNQTGADASAYTTTLTTDELGRVVAVAQPAVQTETSGGAPVSERPTVATGYNTFGDVTHVKQADGSVTTTTYDKLGRKTGVTYPQYTPPGSSTAITPTESWTYDALGNVTQHTDRRGASYDYVFNSQARVVAAYDPLLAGRSARGTTRTTYDELGRPTTVVDQNGASRSWAHDALGRTASETVSVRHPDGSVADNTTAYAYNDLGGRVQSVDPSGATTRASYNAAGEQVTSTDPSGAATTYTYDVAGRPVSTTDPLGRKTVSSFDLAGRRITQARYSPAGSLLTTESSTYDTAGNPTSQTSGRGYVTTMTYDATNRLISVVTPGDHGEGITTTAGYDAAGNLTRQSDGRGYSTIRTYAAGGLLESVIEPSTAAHPSASERTWTTTYDAAAQPVREDQPGGVTILRTFDALGRLLSESGSGTGVTAAARSFGYDLVGRRTSVNAPGGQNDFTFDDRGLLTGTSGPSGAATFNYDEAEHLTEREDATGLTTFDYNSRGLVATAVDSLTHATRTYAYDAASQLSAVSVAGADGTGSHRDFVYDSLGRVTSDKLSTAGGTVTASATYGYDSAGNLTSKALSLPSNPAAGQQTFTYDQQDRLKSWTSASGVTMNYSWDNAGNRTQAGTATFTYDARNRQLTGPDGTRSWSANGNLLAINNAGTAVKTYSYDALSRITVIQAGSTSTTQTYDGLDRVLTQGGSAVGYAGISIKPMSSGTELFARDAHNDLLSVSNGATALLTGADVHHDLTYVADSSGTVVGNRVYDPFGTLQASVGSITTTLGFQSDLTAAASGDVWMGARWYGPTDNTFRSEDSVVGTVAQPSTLNRYTYAEGDPVGGFDPDGHSLPAPEGVSWYRYLKLKQPYQHGDDVSWVQRHLNWAGASLVADGIFGPRTSNAVFSFQRTHARELDVDGIVGPRTWSVLARFSPRPGPAPKPQPKPVNHHGTNGYCAFIEGSLGPIGSGGWQFCALETKDGAQVGVSMTAAGGLGVKLSEIKNFSGIRNFVKQHGKDLLKAAGGSANFVWQTSNARQFDDLSEWASFTTSGFSVRVGPVTLSGSHTKFFGTADGEEWAIGVGEKGLPFDFGTGGGRAYTWIVEAKGDLGFLRTPIHLGIKLLDSQTVAQRWVLNKL